jgi:hypothetical protein
MVRLRQAPQILVEHGDMRANSGGDASPVPLRRLQANPVKLPADLQEEAFFVLASTAMP